jgi:hypothetical protein
VVFGSIGKIIYLQTDARSSTIMEKDLNINKMRFNHEK